MEKSGVAKANALYRTGDYCEALKLYERLSKRPGWTNLLQANIKLCRKKLQVISARQSVSNHRYANSEKSPAIVVTMTTIQSRLQYVSKVIESLSKQTLNPIRIDLNISRDPYLLDQGIEPNDPVLLDLMSMPLLHVNWVANNGSYRKIVPFLTNHFARESTEDSLFITVDDDTLYPEYFMQRLYDEYLRHNCIIAFRGRHIELNEGVLTNYDKWTWGQEHPSLNNLPTGKDGILYSTKFFTRDFLNLTEAQRIAPTADDLWIKWHCALNGVPSIVLNPEACTSDYKSFPVVNYDKEYRNNSLYAQHNKSEGALGKNDEAVRKLEEYYMQTYGYNLAWLIQSECQTGEEVLA